MSSTAPGMYLLPGLINSHVHLQDERAGIAQPFEYEYKVWLSCGITTVRDVGSDIEESFAERRKSQEGLDRRAAPLYLHGRRRRDARRGPQVRPGDQGTGRGRHQDLRHGPRYHGGRSSTKRRSSASRWPTTAASKRPTPGTPPRFGVATIEHWYGIPDAALKGSQNFPPSYNYNNESDRFRWAGRLWREADPAKLDAVLTR